VEKFVLSLDQTLELDILLQELWLSKNSLFFSFFFRQGATVILSCRDMQKCEETNARIKNETGKEASHLIPLDLSNFSSIRQFVEQFHTKSIPLHVLINNAGVCQGLGDPIITKDGLELTLQVNTIGTMLLTCLLLEDLKKSSPSRIVMVNSKGHFGGVIDFDNLKGEKSYFGFTFYKNSKLALMLLSQKLNEKLKGSGVTINNLHPGLVATDIARSNMIGNALFKVVGITPERGAETSLYLAMEPSVEKVTGKYYDNCTEIPYLNKCDDEALQTKMWNYFTQVTGFE